MGGPDHLAGDGAQGRALLGLGSGTEGDPGPWVGELCNMWKPTAQQGLRFQGGNLMQSRFHSLHLALQLKARMEGLPVAVYRGGGKWLIVKGS